MEPNERQDTEQQVAIDGVALLDTAGNVVRTIGRPDGDQAVRAHAATASAATVDPILTDLATGYPMREIDEVMEWFMPETPVPLKFQYRAKVMQNVLGGTKNDQIGATGEARVIVPDPESLVAAELIFRGLETPITLWDEQAAAAGLGTSVAMLEAERAEFLIKQIRNGRVMRFVDVMNTAAGAATAVTIYTDQNPYQQLRTYLDAVILEAGGPQNVHVVMGYSTRNGFSDHPKLNGVADGQWHPVPDSSLATGFGIPESNIHVSWHQVVATKQGRSASKSVLLAADSFYVYVRNARPSREDNSWMHSFVLRGGIGNGRTAATVTGRSGPIEMYRTPRGSNAYRLGGRYFDLQKATNTATNAKKRLTITWSTEASS